MSSIEKALHFIVVSALSLVLCFFSENAGAKWHIQVVDHGKVPDRTSLKIDRLGNLHLAFGGSSLLYAKKEGGEWTIQTVDDSRRVGSEPSLVLDQWDNPLISYYDGYYGDLKFARWDGNQWRIETVASVGDVGEYTSLALDQAGNPAIAYLDSDSRALKFARWDGDRWNTEVVDATWEVGEYPSLAYDPAGHPAISYY